MAVLTTEELDRMEHQVFTTEQLDQMEHRVFTTEELDKIETEKPNDFTARMTEIERAVGPGGVKFTPTPTRTISEIGADIGRIPGAVKTALKTGGIWAAENTARAVQHGLEYAMKVAPTTRDPFTPGFTQPSLPQLNDKEIRAIFEGAEPIPGGGGKAAQAVFTALRIPDMIADVTQAKREEIEGRQPKFTFKESPITYVAERVAKQLPVMGTALIASAFGGPGVGLAVMGFQEFGNAAEQQARAGASINQQTAIGGLSTIAEVGGEMLVFPKVFGGIKAGGFSARQIANIVLENAGQEGVTGFFQQAFQTFGEENIKGTDTKKAIGKAVWAGLGAIPENFWVGGLSVGVITTSTTAAGKALDTIKHITAVKETLEKPDAESIAIVDAKIDEVQQDTTIPEEQKKTIIGILGNIVGDWGTKIIDKIPGEITDLKSLEEWGNKVAKELGVDKILEELAKKHGIQPNIVWQVSDRNVMKMAHAEGPGIGGTQDRFGIKIFHWDWQLRTQKESDFTKQELKRTIIHELGHFARKPYRLATQYGRGKRHVHHPEFKSWVDASVKNMFPEKRVFVPRKETVPQEIELGETAEEAGEKKAAEKQPAGAEVTFAPVKATETFNVTEVNESQRERLRKGESIPKMGTVRDFYTLKSEKDGKFTVSVSEGSITTREAMAKPELLAKPAEGAVEKNLATPENLKALGAVLTGQSSVSESQYYKLGGMQVRLSEHWGASKALPLLYRGDYGDLLQRLVDVSKMPMETKAQRKEQFARRLEIKDAIRKRSNQIWSERLEAVKKGKPSPVKSAEGAEEGLKIDDIIISKKGQEPWRVISVNKENQTVIISREQGTDTPSNTRKISLKSLSRFYTYDVEDNKAEQTTPAEGAGEKQPWEMTAQDWAKRHKSELPTDVNPRNLSVNSEWFRALEKALSEGIDVSEEVLNSHIYGQRTKRESAPDWMLTKKEFNERIRKMRAVSEGLTNIREDLGKDVGLSPYSDFDKGEMAVTHETLIMEALAEGETVPRRVLEGYKGKEWADAALAKIEKPAVGAVEKQPPASAAEKPKGRRPTVRRLQKQAHKIARDYAVDRKEYEDLAEQVTGKRSMKDMDKDQMIAFVDALKETYGPMTGIKANDLDRLVYHDGKWVPLRGVLGEVVTTVTNLPDLGKGVKRVTVGRVGAAARKLTVGLWRLTGGINRSRPGRLSNMLGGFKDTILTRIFQKNLIQDGSNHKADHIQAFYEGDLQKFLAEKGFDSETLAKISRSQWRGSLAYEFTKELAGIGLDRVDVKFSDRTYSITRDSLLSDYLQARQPEGMAHLLEDGGVFEEHYTGPLTQEEVLRQIIEPAERDPFCVAMAEFIDQHAPNHLRHPVNEISVPLVGKAIATKEMYFPLDVVETPRYGKLGFKLKTKKPVINLFENPSCLKARKGPTGPLRLDGSFFDTIHTVEEAVSDYVAYAPTLRLVLTILSNKEIVDTWRQKGYGDVHRVLSAIIENEMGSVGPRSAIETALAALTRGAAQGLFHWNLKTAGIQYSSLMLMKLHFDAKYRRAGIKGMMSHKMGKEFMTHVPWAWTRYYDDRGPQMIGGISETQGLTLPMQGKYAANQMGVWLLKFSDLGPFHATFWAAIAEYDDRKNLRPGTEGYEFWHDKPVLEKDTPGYWALILERFTMARQGQQSYDKFDRSMNTSRKDVASKLAFLFQSFHEGAWNVLQSSWDKLVHSEWTKADRKKFWKAFGAVFASYATEQVMRDSIIIVMMFAWAGIRRRKPKAPLEWYEWILRPFISILDAIPIFGNQLNQQIRNFTRILAKDKPLYSGRIGEPLPLQIIDSLFEGADTMGQGVAYCLRGETKKGTERIMKGFAKITEKIALTQGVPTYEIKRIRNSIEKPTIARPPVQEAGKRPVIRRNP